MDYTVALYIEQIPGAVIKSVNIGGTEQKCLCLPIDHSVFHLAKSGKRFLQIALHEKEEMNGTESHYVLFCYPNPEVKDKSIRTRKCGRCSISQPHELNKDTTVYTTFKGHGVICLDDIPEDAISTDSLGKRYLRIMVQPMTKKDRGGNDLIVAVDPEYGADHGRRESLLNGYDAPLAEVGRMKHYDPNDELKKQHQEGNDKPEENDRTIGGYRF